MTKKRCILTSLIRLACSIAQEGSYYVPVVKNGAVGQVWHQILQVGLLSYCDDKRKRVHFQEEEMTQQHRERFVFGCSGEKNKLVFASVVQIPVDTVERMTNPQVPGGALVPPCMCTRYVQSTSTKSLPFLNAQY